MRELASCAAVYFALLQLAMVYAHILRRWYPEREVHRRVLATIWQLTVGFFCFAALLLIAAPA
jgi:hypothetical protein